MINFSIYKTWNKILSFTQSIAAKIDWQILVRMFPYKEAQEFYEECNDAERECRYIDKNIGYFPEKIEQWISEFMEHVRISDGNSLPSVFAMLNNGRDSQDYEFIDIVLKAIVHDLINDNRKVYEAKRDLFENSLVSDNFNLRDITINTLLYHFNHDGHILPYIHLAFEKNDNTTQMKRKLQLQVESATAEMQEIAKKSEKFISKKFRNPSF